jgi:UDP-2,4-diacetamido-2,4,6-trideoxy-beta-L-altropyranose hydrolase
MRIVFRTDVSLQIGSGHVMRCLTLADALREQGAECQFICREHEGHMTSLIGQRGYPVKALPTPTNTSKPAAKPAHAAWLGCDWEADAEQTRQAIGAGVVDWLIVDHYALDRRWHQALRPYTKRLMVIDDLADRPLDCDILLDQNYGSSPSRYAGLVPQHCLQLHGPEYALLKPAYAEHRAKTRQRSGAIQRVLIYIGGGADQADLTGQTVRAFDHQELADIHLDVVVSAAYTHLSSLQAFSVQRGNVSLHSHLPDLADLMAHADLAIGAGGATTWERCCMGLPTIVISIAENQRRVCEALDMDGVIKYLGGVSKGVSRIVLGAVLMLTKKPAILKKMGDIGIALVDGKGVGRVQNRLMQISLGLST